MLNRVNQKRKSHHFVLRSGYNTPLSHATPPPPPSLHAGSTSFSSFRPSPVPSSRPTSPPPLSNTDLEILREIVTICENHLGRDVQPLAETLAIPFKVGLCCLLLGRCSLFPCAFSFRAISVTSLFPRFPFFSLFRFSMFLQSFLSFFISFFPSILLIHFLFYFLLSISMFSTVDLV